MPHIDKFVMAVYIHTYIYIYIHACVCLSILGLWIVYTAVEIWSVYYTQAVCYRIIYLHMACILCNYMEYRLNIAHRPHAIQPVDLFTYTQPGKVTVTVTVHSFRYPKVCYVTLYDT